MHHLAHALLSVRGFGFDARHRRRLATPRSDALHYRRGLATPRGAGLHRPPPACITLRTLNRACAGSTPRAAAALCTYSFVT